MISFPSVVVTLEGGGWLRLQSLPGELVLTVGADSGPQPDGAAAAKLTPREASLLAAAAKAAAR